MSGEIPVPQPVGDEEMAGENVVGPNLCEHGNLTVAMTMLANESAAGSGRRTSAADQLASDSQRMWSVHMTTPTVLAGLGFQTAIGGGKTSPGKGATE